jgi:hypothetical protein
VFVVPVGVALPEGGATAGLTGGYGPARLPVEI